MEMAMPSTIAKSEQSAVQEIATRLEGIHKDFSMIADRMQRVIDRAFGSSPEASGSTGQPRAVPSGEIGTVRDQIDRLDALASNHASLMSRIDGIV
jgi:hypothetical protein